MKARAEADVKSIPQSRPRAKALDYLDLTKPRIAVMVLFSAFAGYFMAAGSELDYALAVHMMIGTLLVAGGANAVNMVIERDRDALMKRTHDRPLPSGRMPVAEALGFGLILAVGGTIYLAIFTTLLAAALAAATFLLYTLVYTPLKPATSLNTAIGAAPGAIPPLIGWAAARGDLNLAALSIFAILYLWQFPHFFAIAWIYREDYARGGFKMLPVTDPTGESTARHILFQGLALICVSLLPSTMGLTGRFYFFSALALGLAFWAFGWVAALRRTEANARRLLLASVIYLPLLLIAMIADKQ
jgi:protoheme IX farnesyltransferase